ncbi:hypothetical protein Nmel_007164 [Mimus melanotis]
MATGSTLAQVYPKSEGGNAACKDALSSVFH